MSVRMEKTKNYSDVYEIEIDAFLNPWSEAAVKEEVENPLSSYYVIYSENNPIAYMGFIDLKGELEITNIAVKKSYQNKGYGKMLLNKLTEVKEELKADKIFLEVREDNTAAIRLYEKFGFKKISVRKDYYGKDINAIIYERE